MSNASDSWNLNQFIDAQTHDYDIALQEIRTGRKRTHWVWYIFPQLRGLGMSESSYYYGITGMAEARAYLADPVLYARLIEITTALLQLNETNPDTVLGRIDAIKVCSCMTLFEAASGPKPSLFSQVLEKYYGGYRDQKTLAMLGIIKPGDNGYYTITNMEVEQNEA